LHPFRGAASKGGVELGTGIVTATFTKRRIALNPIASAHIIYAHISRILVEL
jgi:hypothetical protein